MLKVEDIEEATRLRNYRRNALHVLADIRGGIFDAQVGVDQISLATHINIMPVRTFCAEQLVTHIQDIEGQLRVLGVEVEETTL